MVSEALSPPPIEAIEAAQERIAGAVLRTPLIRLNVDDAPATIYLKLENLQPIGSFKLRGASNAMAMASPEQLARGVYTASAGNMAQGVAWNARRLGIPCTVIVPDHAPEAKLAAVTRLGAGIIKVPFDTWWQVLIDRSYPDLDGLFIHPFSDGAVMAGNGTIGLEIVEDLPDVDAVVIPFGGGGLSCGIASAIRAVKPGTEVFACEVDTAAPVAASFAAGSPQVVSYTPTFVDGMGSKSLMPEIWPLVSRLLNGSIVVSLAEVVAALKLLIERNRVVAEGAGAAPVAAALTGRAGSGNVVCVISGGNIDVAKVAHILSGQEVQPVVEAGSIPPMKVTYAFACLPVTDRDEAIRWYERLLGKRPTFLPHDREAVWQLAATASLYVLVDADRAGHGMVTLVVDDLDATLAEIAARGITPGPIDQMPGAGRKSVITDPDGNEVGLVEIVPSHEIPQGEQVMHI